MRKQLFSFRVFYDLDSFFFRIIYLPKRRKTDRSARYWEWFMLPMAWNMREEESKESKYWQVKWYSTSSIPFSEDFVFNTLKWPKIVISRSAFAMQLWTLNNFPQCISSFLFSSFSFIIPAIEPCIFMFFPIVSARE